MASHEYERAANLLREAATILSAGTLPSSSTSSTSTTPSSTSPTLTTPSSTNPTSTTPSSTSPTSTTSSSTSQGPVQSQIQSDSTLQSLQNLRNLFSPYASTSLRSYPSSRGTAVSHPPSKRARFSQIRETWTHDFLCLAGKDTQVIPNKAEKLALIDAGLGRRKIVFGNKDDSLSFKETLEKAYPKLKAGGGFELLRSGVRPGELILIKPSPRFGYSVPYLRDVAGLGQAIAYVRPLQQDLDRSVLDEPSQSQQTGNTQSVLVPCLGCGKSVEMTKLREHHTACTKSDKGLQDNTGNQGLPSNQSDTKELSRLKDIFPNKSSAELSSVLKKADSFEIAASTLAMELDDDDFDDDDTDSLPSLADVMKPSTSTSTCTSTKPPEPRNFKEAIEMAGKNLQPISSDDKRLRINVRRKKLWDNTVQIFKSLSEEELSHQLNVTFVGEEAVDIGGPKREYFSALFQEVDQQRIVQGNSPTLTFSHDVLALEAKEYQIYGNLIALSLLNGCSGPHNLSPSLAKYVTHEDKHALDCKVEEVPDPETKQRLLEIAEAKDEKEFKDKVALLDERFDAGFNKASVSLEDKDKLLKTVVYHNIINVCHEEILQFKKGLSFGNVLDAIQKFPVEGYTELTHNNESIVTPDVIEKLFDINLSSKGSNKRASEEDIVFNWTNFFSKVHSGKVTQSIISLEDDTFEEKEKILTLGDVLMFTTGSYYLPVMGFKFKPYVEFDHDAPPGTRLSANTCGPSLTFPVTSRYTCTLEEFCRNVSEDIISSPGFGMV